MLSDGIVYQRSNNGSTFGSEDDAVRVPKSRPFPGWIEIIEQSSSRGWALVILPYEVRIDNFHGPLHVHPPRGRGPPVPIADRTLAAVRERVRRHVEAQGTVVYAELLEDLR